MNDLSRAEIIEAEIVTSGTPQQGKRRSWLRLALIGVGVIAFIGLGAYVITSEKHKDAAKVADMVRNHPRFGATSARKELLGVNPLRNVTKGKFGQEGVVRSVLFERDINVYIEEGGSVAYAQKCADYLNSIPATVIDHVCAASIRYCNAVRDDIGEPPLTFECHRDVLGMVSAAWLDVPVSHDDSDPVVHMEMKCEWEEEHGMEWIIRGDKVLYVGEFTGEDPLRDFTVKNRWNYA